MLVRIIILIVLIIGFIVSLVIKNEDLATTFNLLIFFSMFNILYKFFNR